MPYRGLADDGLFPRETKKEMRLQPSASDSRPSPSRNPHRYQAGSEYSGSERPLLCSPPMAPGCCKPLQDKEQSLATRPLCTRRAGKTLSLRCPPCAHPGDPPEGRNRPHFGATPGMHSRPVKAPNHDLLSNHVSPAAQTGPTHRSLPYVPPTQLNLIFPSCALRWVDE
jgi:hypothetical protein